MTSNKTTSPCPHSELSSARYHQKDGSAYDKCIECGFISNFKFPQNPVQQAAQQALDKFSKTFEDLAHFDSPPLTNQDDWEKEWDVLHGSGIGIKAPNSIEKSLARKGAKDFIKSLLASERSRIRKLVEGIGKDRIFKRAECKTQREIESFKLGFDQALSDVIKLLCP